MGTKPIMYPNGCGSYVHIGLAATCIIQGHFGVIQCTSNFSKNSISKTLLLLQIAAEILSNISWVIFSLVLTKLRLGFYEDHWEENSGHYWKPLSAISMKSGVLKFSFPFGPQVIENEKKILKISFPKISNIPLTWFCEDHSEKNSGEVSAVICRSSV